LSSSRKSLHGLQAFECTLGWAGEELAAKQKGTVVNDSALPVTRVSVHARLTAVAYEEEGALVHGLDGAHRQHLLSWCSYSQGSQDNAQLLLECE